MTPSPSTRLGPLRPIARFGEFALHAAHLVLRAALALGRTPPASILQQLGRLAWEALPITMVATGLAGAVTAMQSSVELSRLGAGHLVADIAAVGFVRELGPLLAGLLLAARGGAGAASELGMTVFDGQVQALHALGMDVDRELVAPRLAALALGGLWLTAAAILSGWLGALAVCTSQLGLEGHHFWYRLLWAVTPGDIAGGLAKGLVFGALIGAVSLTYGLRDKRGPADVGRDTMRAVVGSSAAVLLADPVLTGLIRLMEAP